MIPPIVRILVENVRMTTEWLLKKEKDGSADIFCANTPLFGLIDANTNNIYIMMIFCPFVFISYLSDSSVCVMRKLICRLQDQRVSESSC